MKVCIHRGTREIGGSCIEVSAEGRRLLLDLGQPLDDDRRDELPASLDLNRPIDAIVISHGHLDHYGLLGKVPAGTSIVAGAATKRILEAAAVFIRDQPTLDGALEMRDRQPLRIGPVTITPFLVDHSAFDAYAVLVEAGGKRLFYSGDLRAHGRKGALFERLVRQPPADVDVLLLEGTTLGRPAGAPPTEEDVADRLTEICQQTPGIVLVWASGQNIDRLVSLYKAARRARRVMIVDMYTAHVLRATEYPSIPQASWRDVRVYLPRGQRRRIKQLEAWDVAALYKARRIYPDKLAAVSSKAVMLFRPSMMAEVERHANLRGGCFVHSMWQGYLHQDQQRGLRAWLDKHQLILRSAHTSGHATPVDLARLAGALSAKMTVPIHSQQPELLGEHLGNVVAKADGAWWEI